MTIETGDTVEVEFTGRTDDGTVFDTSRESVASGTALATARPHKEYSPLVVEVGSGRVIDGLENALVGLEQGTTSTVAVPPEKGFGAWSDEKVREYDVEELTRGLGGETPEVGELLKLNDGDKGEITGIEDGVVRVDFNSPLAGETLEFDIEVLSVN